MCEFVYALTTRENRYSCVRVSGVLSAPRGDSRFIVIVKWGDNLIYGWISSIRFVCISYRLRYIVDMSAGKRPALAHFRCPQSQRWNEAHKRPPLFVRERERDSSQLQVDTIATKSERSKCDEIKLSVNDKTREISHTHTQTHGRCETEHLTVQF